jgi:hypothetical protein
MRPRFEEWWANLPALLPRGTDIRAWSEHSGYTGGTFRFVEIDWDGALVIKSPLRRISIGDFEMVYKLWPEYRDGIVPRSKINAITVNSTYIIGILHWFDEQAEH